MFYPESQTMKVSLKRKYGYLHIDDNNVYVSRFSKWPNENKLEEKNFYGFQSENFFSKLKISLYVALGIGLSFLGIVETLYMNDIRYSLIIAIPLVAYFSFRHFIPEFNLNFVIPKTKIKGIKRDNNTVSIRFLDANNKLTSNHFHDLDTEGLAIFDSLKHETSA